MARALKDVTGDPLAKLQADIKREGKKTSTGLNEDEKMLNTRVPASLLRRLKIYSVTAGIPIKEIVAEVIEEKLKKLGY